MTSITNEKDFNDLIKSSDPFVVDFSASWCGPCKMLSPVLEKLSTSMQNVKFVKIDVEQLSGLSEKYGITGVPTLVFLKNETEVNRVVGALSESKLQSVISKSFGL